MSHHKAGAISIHAPLMVYQLNLGDLMKYFIASLVIAIAAASCSAPAEKADEQPTTQTSEDAPKTDGEATPEGDTDEDNATTEEALQAAANGPHRSDENKARNEFRNPVETLTFFGLERDMTVVELWSGGGWYTEVLAPVLADDGVLIAANFAAKKDDPEHYRSKLRVKMDERIANDPVFAKVVHGTFEPGSNVDAGEPGSADMVVSFRNVHSFIRSDIHKQVFAEAYKVLKPGGIFGVVQHRAKEGVDPIKSADTGYVPEAFVIQLAEEAGFELVEKSEVNANPKDTADHPEGVWTLPPSLRLGDKDKEKYVAIGESDRMTLKFRKPAESADAGKTAEPAAK